MPIPLLPIQILWVNLITDGLPGLALAVEPEEKGNMQRPPRPPAESFFAGGLGAHVVWVGCLIGGLVDPHAGVGDRARLARTGRRWCSPCSSFAQLFHVMAIRSDDIAVHGRARSNLPLLGAVLVGVALQLAAIYVPALQRDHEDRSR